MNNSANHEPKLSAAHIDFSEYQSLYQQSLNEPENFWRTQAERLNWIQKPTIIKNTNFKTDVSIRWFEDGKLNVSANCIDRHLEKNADKIAIIWEGDLATEQKKITYRELHQEVCRCANLLKSYGISKGDRVLIYLPMIPEAAITMLACTRIGAVHSVVFAGFSAESLKGRIKDCQPKIIITADEALRGGRKIPLKKMVDEALQDFPNISKTLVVKRTNAEINWLSARDICYQDAIKNMDDKCEAEAMDAEDPLFILYTSGSTGKPKGILHSSAGYLLYASLTHHYIFNHQPNDIYWCTADIGWITGHSYVVYGPLANGATTLMFEGVPSFPDFGRFWDIIERHKVSIFYTAPTAIRALMKEGNEYVERYNRSSLRILGSVGEPINPEAWLWYYNIVGNSNCPIVDTWWQTETGGILISPLPGTTPLKPGSATLPFFGAKPEILDANGKKLTGEAEGFLCFSDSWPGQARSLFGDHQRFQETYFQQFPGYYCTGDGAKRDADGYYWITGRIDDVLNVSGHRLGTAEIESALVAHPLVAEAAVVGYPHPIKGQGIYAFVILKSAAKLEENLATDLSKWVGLQIGAIAKPDLVHITPNLPKTRSGKIMRRILRKIAEDDLTNFGDTNTLMNPECVDYLIETRLNLQTPKIPA
jgi:acetyl-CoA synthetase